jgi:hypothetical protein
MAAADAPAPLPTKDELLDKLVKDYNYDKLETPGLTYNGTFVDSLTRSQTQMNQMRAAFCQDLASRTLPWLEKPFKNDFPPHRNALLEGEDAFGWQADVKCTHISWSTGMIGIPVNTPLLLFWLNRYAEYTDVAASAKLMGCPRYISSYQLYAVYQDVVVALRTKFGEEARYKERLQTSKDEMVALTKSYTKNFEQMIATTYKPDIDLMSKTAIQQKYHHERLANANEHDKLLLQKSFTDDMTRALETHAKLEKVFLGAMAKHTVRFLNVVERFIIDILDPVDPAIIPSLLTDHRVPSINLTVVSDLAVWARDFYLLDIALIKQVSKETAHPPLTFAVAPWAIAREFFPCNFGKSSWLVLCGERYVPDPSVKKAKVASE